MVKVEERKVAIALAICWSLIMCSFVVLSGLESANILILDPELRISWPNIFRDLILGSVSTLFLVVNSPTLVARTSYIISASVVSALVTNVRQLSGNEGWVLSLAFSVLQWFFLLIVVLVLLRLLLPPLNSQRNGN